MVWFHVTDPVPFAKYQGRHCGSQVRNVIKPTSCVRNLGELFDSVYARARFTRGPDMFHHVVYGLYVDNSAVKSQPD